MDDPVAIHPNETRLILLETVGVGIAGCIKPNARPTLSVMRRGQQLLDRMLIGCLTPLILICGKLFSGGRQTDQIERNSAEQCIWIRSRRRLQSLVLQSCEHESVNTVANPGFAFNIRK